MRAGERLRIELELTVEQKRIAALITAAVRAAREAYACWRR